MSNTVISVENLSKSYRLGQIGTGTLTNDLKVWWAKKRGLPNPLMRIGERDHGNRDGEIVWALKDVSFSVNQGEVLGIIGHNGAGKSTLLKILSRVTAPTSGQVKVKGRIASLLEVGTGFHPDLTGRENIFLNGAILGMTKGEVQRKFDEIVDFSGIDKYIDTPVKRYSSGMYVRLAFAVAAHLDPEILIVDEVLAVGDAAFQKKCLGKMGDVAKEGRTVLFVSHNLPALLNLCPRAMLLVAGLRRQDGPSNEIVKNYIDLGRTTQGEVIWEDMSLAPGNDRVRLHAVRLISDGRVTNDVEIDQELRIEIEFWNLQPGAHLNSSIHLLDRIGSVVLASANMNSANLIRDEWYGVPHPSGLYRTVCLIPANFLNTETYSINAIVLSDVTNIQVNATEVISFTVHETGAMRKEYIGGWIGVIRPRLAWQTEMLAPLNGQQGTGEPV
jgi:lipopolysaccharide transport system ATP-binding protein